MGTHLIKFYKNSSSQLYLAPKYSFYLSQELHFDPGDTGEGALQTADGHVGGYEERIFSQGGFDQGVAAGNIRIGIGPGGHPGGLFDFDEVVVEVAEAVESLAF